VVKGAQPKETSPTLKMAPHNSHKNERMMAPKQTPPTLKMALPNTHKNDRTIPSDHHLAIADHSTHFS